ncbi:MAG: 4Fe-4S binding protein [Candidatus Hydrogenedentes bacterium]|nr:4Fe-4S binding protein [Candidatus Hydrogenedentota bacterium]
MKKKKNSSATQWIRRVSQLLFFFIFIYFVWKLHFIKEEDEYLKIYNIFFDLDPLIFLLTSLSTWSLESLSYWWIITLIITILLGRVFCGWFCPFGAYHTFFSWIANSVKKKKDYQSRSIAHRTKYFIFFLFLGMSIFGTQWFGILDPFSFFYRTLTTSVFPAFQVASEDISNLIYQKDPNILGFHLTYISEPVRNFLRNYVFKMTQRPYYTEGTLLFITLLLVTGLNFIRPRFWCRYICPLGGLLGLISLKPILRLFNDESTCTNCRLCSKACPAGAQPDQRGNWLPTECFVCWNCVESCKSGSINFKFNIPGLKTIPTGKIDYPRRMVVTAMATGAVGMLGFKVQPQAKGGQPFPEFLIRPPGARSEKEFLQRCIQCGACMRACPTNGLQPTGLEAGWEGLWTPKLVPKIGYCLYNCNLCGKICPTKAIQHLPLQEKQKTKIGLATFDKGRCIPYSYGRECIVCEEHCPLSPKAIYLVEREITLRNGEVVKIKQPEVDANLCIGCGMCEWSCVFQDKAAIRVTCANESRNSNNQPILPSDNLY